MRGNLGLFVISAGHHADGALQAGEASRLQADLQDHEEAARCFTKHRLSHALLQHHAPGAAAPRPGRVVGARGKSQRRAGEDVALSVLAVLCRTS